MDVAVEWIKRIAPVQGLDPIGTQQPCIQIYAHLMPGITNVTDRAHYYTFYPWLYRSLDTHRPPPQRTRERLREDLRRAEVLLTLISKRHAVDLEDNLDAHSPAMIGALTLNGVAQRIGGELPTVRLSDFTWVRKGSESNSKAYFQNPYGGLAQYYGGQLDQLSILLPDREAGYKYRRPLGEELAAAADHALDSEAFLNALDRDEITVDDLRLLSDFCPCNLTHSGRAAERDALVQLFFNEPPYENRVSANRRTSLGLMLHFVRSLEGAHPFDRDLFFDAVYGLRLPDGQPWIVPPGLKLARLGWSIYQTNELYALAMQAIFYGLLRLCEREPAGALNVEELADWAARHETTGEAIRLVRAGLAAPDTVETVADAAAVLGRTLPELAATDNPGHEMAVARAMMASITVSGNGPPESIPDVLSQAARVLLSVSIRLGGAPNPYAPLGMDLGFFRDYPLNLAQFSQGMAAPVQALTLREWFRALFLDVLRTHMTVALRKLRHMGKDTFRIKPTPDGFDIQPVVAPAPTNPRFNQARQILFDLGAVEFGDFGDVITPLGEAKLAEILA